MTLKENKLGTKKAEEAIELLKIIYKEVGPYRDGKIHADTLERLKNYFGFIDK